MKDRRSKTSRANLGEHVPEALSPEGTVTVAVRIPTPLAERLDRARGALSRSEWLRTLIQRSLQED